METKQKYPDRPPDEGRVEGGYYIEVWRYNLGGGLFREVYRHRKLDEMTEAEFAEVNAWLNPNG